MGKREKERVLITGGAGYLGSVLVGHLLEEGYGVTCLDNFLYNNQHSIFNYVTNPDFEFVFGDARNKGLLKELVQDKDVIIPLAAIVGMPACDAKPIEAESINRDAVILIDEIRDNQKISS